MEQCNSHSRHIYYFCQKSGNRLRFWINIRDYFGLFAIPFATAFVATAEFLPNLVDRKLALFVLAVSAVLQGLLAGRSLVRRWDDQRGYCSNAMRDSHDMQTAWQEIGKGDVTDLSSAYELRKALQRIIDSLDIEQEISDKEKISGMRAGLFQVQRSCFACRKVPKSRRPPFFAIERCEVCGGRRDRDGAANALSNKELPLTT